MDSFDSFDRRKSNTIKELQFCKVLMDKLLSSAKEEFKPYVVIDDIKRLRRELNLIAKYQRNYWR